MTKKSSAYKFLSDNEPTEAQLHLLISEVAKEAKQKSEKANLIFMESLKKQIVQAFSQDNGKV